MLFDLFLGKEEMMNQYDQENMYRRNSSYHPGMQVMQYHTPAPRQGQGQGHHEHPHVPGGFAHSNHAYESNTEVVNAPEHLSYYA